jgi:predicted HTH transcriptional regulator
MNNPDRPTEERDDKLNALMILKSKVQKDNVKFGEMGDAGQTHVLEKKMDDILFRIREMDRKIENVRRERIYEFMEMERLSKKAGPEEESPRTKKVKGMIKSLLEEHGKLSAAQLSNMIKLSRTRCSEYLTEMERKEIIEGTTVRRQKFFQLKR